LVESGRVVAQYSSLSGGVISFSATSLNIAAGQTRKLTLAIDPATALTAGNTVSFTLKSASDVKGVDAASATANVMGSFPLNGNTFTVTSVSNPAIASVTFSSSSVGTSVYAGTPGVLVSQWTVSVQNSPVNLTSVKFQVVGSTDMSHLQNLKLRVNGNQVGNTVPVASSDGTVYFDFSASPARLQTGSSNIQVYSDIMGSPNRNFDFGILNSYDVYAIDTQYNVPVSVTINGGGTGSTSGHQVSINQGQITVTSASDTPTGNIAKGASGVTLAKFNIYAAGEAVKVKFIDARLTTSASSTGVWSAQFQNIYLVDDQGIQIGTTINNIVDGSSSGQCTLAATTATCHIGTSSSNINYIIPANVTRTISVKADVLSTASGWTTVTASLPSQTANLQGQTSSQSANSGAANGGALTLAATPLTASLNAAVGTQTYAKGATAIKIGSYTLTASAAEGVNVSNVTISMSASSTDFQNLMVKVDGVQFGTTQSTLSGSQVVAFAGSSPIAIPSGASKSVEIYADVLSSASSATLMTGLTTLTSCTGTGATTFTSVSCSPTSITGQSVTISAGANLTIAASSATAPAKQVVMGSTSNSLATFRFTETSNVESVKINTLRVLATTTAAQVTAAGFSNVKLYQGSNVVGSATASSTAASSTWMYVFNFSTPVVVQQNGSTELEMKGDIASFSSGGASSNKIYQFQVASSTVGESLGTNVTAIGGQSNTALTGANLTWSNAFGNLITTLRTKLTLTGSTLGATSGRSRTAIDEVANLVFAADSGFDATVNSVIIKFQGLPVSTSAAFSVRLIDPSTGSDWSSLPSTVTCTTAANSCTATFNFTSVPTISAGTSKTVKVRIDSSSFANPGTSPESMTVLINAAGDVNWGDGTTTLGLTLENTVVPVQVANVSYD
jgi:hypothetical protein